MNTYQTETIDMGNYDAAKLRELYDVEARVTTSLKTRDLIRESHWAGATTPEGISKYLMYGDDATARTISRMVKSLDVTLTAHTMKPVWSDRHVAGQRFNVDRVLTGDARPWGRYERAKAHGQRVISLYVGIGGSAGCSIEALGWRPAATIAVADALETAGYRVELWCYCATHNPAEEPEKRYGVRFPLKAAQDPVDVLALSRAAHAAAFRGWALPLTEVRFHAVYGFTIGRGGGRTLKEPASEIFNDPDALSLPPVFNRDDARAAIDKLIAKFQ